MITVNDKIKLFTNRIIKLQQDKYDGKLVELEDDMFKKFKKKEKELINDREKYKEYLLKGIKVERAQRLFNARSEKKRRILLKRKDMIDSLLNGVNEYTEKFIKTDEYEKYLEDIVIDNIEVIKNMNDIIIYMSKDDLEKYKNVINNILIKENVINNNFQECENKILGGLIIVNSDKSYRLDMSIDSVIIDNREYMGQLIYSILEEAGD